MLLEKKSRSFPEKDILKQLIIEGLVRIIGPIRQELLSGIVEKKQFDKLKKNLSYFPDLILKTSDFERGADFFNLCRKRGMQGSHTDFLIFMTSKYLQRTKILFSSIKCYLSNC